MSEQAATAGATGGRLARAASWSPAAAAACIVLVYVLFTALFINRCGALDPRCRAPAIRDYLLSHGACPAAGEIPSDDAARLWPGRVLWVFVMGVGLLANLLAVGVSLYQIWRSRDDEGAGRAGVRAAAYALLAFLAFAAAGFYVRPESMMSQMFDLLKCTAEADLPFATRATNVANFVSIGAVACVVAASCALIRPPAGVPQGARELAARMGRLRVLLYAGTVALVVTVLRVSVQAGWALAYLSPDPEKKSGVALAMSNLASAVTSAQAASNTLFLAAVYVPAFLVLRARAVGLADPLLTPPEREEWLRKEGLSVSFSEHLPRIAAILGPLLAGPLGDLLGRLAK